MIDFLFSLRRNLFEYDFKRRLFGRPTRVYNSASNILTWAAEVNDNAVIFQNLGRSGVTVVFAVERRVPSYQLWEMPFFANICLLSTSSDRRPTISTRCFEHTPRWPLTTTTTTLRTRRRKKRRRKRKTLRKPPKSEVKSLRYVLLGKRGGTIVSFEMNG